MKKILTLCVALLVAATTISAKEYKHSLGMVAGLGIGAQYKVMVTDNFTIFEEFGYLGGCIADQAGALPYDGAVNNLVLAYQANAAEGQGIKLDWYVGGQLKAGYLQGGAGIIGVGAVGGIEANMTNAPIAFSFDFRPGYGCLLADDGFGGVGAGHAFDFSFNLGVRYTF